MDKGQSIGILVLVALIALVALGTVAAMADPADTSTAPTEDWVFDEGKTTTINQKQWKIEYNITVMNGSKLVIKDSDFTINGTSEWNPVWIYTDINSTLELTGTDFIVEDGASGFYVECHDNVTITSCEFDGLVNNPKGDGGIAIYDVEVVKLDFLDVHDTMMADAIYLHNCQVSMSNSDIYDMDSNGIVIFVGDNEYLKWYNFSCIDTTVHDVKRGIMLLAYTNYGYASLDCYEVTVYNTTEEGISLDVGDHSSNDNGNGSVYAKFDYVEVYNVGDQGLYTSSLYQQTGTNNTQNEYFIWLTNSTMRNIRNTGIYVQLVYGTVDYRLHVDRCLFQNISNDASFDRLGAIWWWYQLGSGGTQLYAANSTFRDCTPGALFIWDYGGGDFHLFNCTITESTQDGIYQDTKYGYTQSPLLVENCTISDNLGTGVHAYMYTGSQASATIIRVINSTLERNVLASLKMSSSTSSYAKNAGFNITGCLIAHQDAPAVDINLQYPQGTVITHITDTVINDTLGVRSIYSRDYAQGAAGHDVLMLNTSILNSKGTALLVNGRGYYGTKVNFVMVNSTIRKASGDGAYIYIGPESSTYTPTWRGMITIHNSSVEDVGGIALALLAEVTGGTISLEANMTNSTVFGAQRGLFVLLYDLYMANCEVKNVLKEDVLIISGKADLWYNDFTQIDERKFKALDGGQIYFYYDLTIFVKWDTGAPATGANVQIFDNKGTLISVLNVQSNDGSLPTFNMNPYFVRETGLFGTTPYVINVTFLQVSKTLGVRLDRSKVVEIIMEDHFEPEIYILYPKQGHIQQSTTLQVRGSAWDSQSGISKVLLSLDGSHWEEATGKLRWNHTFEVNESLIGRFSGLFNLRAKAIDFAANERTAFVQIRIDPTPPELTIDFPYDGYVTNNPELWVRGVTELGSEIEINGEQVPVTVSMFTHKVTLYEGPNTITVISIDPLGNIQIVRMEVTLDTQKPYLILVSPEEEGAMTSEDTITLEAQLEEKLTVFIKVGGSDEVVIEYDTEHYPKDAGTLTYDIQLQPGDNSIVVMARDIADNLLVLDRVVTYDTTPPWIQVISPMPDEMLDRPEVTIYGTVDPTAQLLIDNEDVTLQNGYFERVILGLPGRNVVNLMAIDAAGNEYSEELRFFVDTDDPSIELETSQVVETVTDTFTLEIGGDKNITVLPKAGLSMYYSWTTDPLTPVSFTRHNAGMTIPDMYTIYSHSDYIANADWTFRWDNDDGDGAVEVSYTIAYFTEIDYTEGAITANDPRYHIRGTAYNFSSILVNGKPYTSIDDGTGQVINKDIEWDSAGNFEIPVDLREGKNTFTVMALDEVENSASETLTVILDTRAPTLVMYVDPISITEEGTTTSHALTVNITGYTDPGSYLEVNGILLPVNEKGEFHMSYDLNPSTSDATMIRIVSMDGAGNSREVEQVIQYAPIKVEDDKGMDSGLMFLIVSLIVLVVVGLVTAYLVRGRREDWLEMEAASATPVAPVDDDLETVVEEVDTLPGPEELDVEKEEEAPEPEEAPAPTSAPARPRPRPPQARRATPKPKPKPAEKPVEKDLSDKGAEDDIGADETDQEGI